MPIRRALLAAAAGLALADAAIVTLALPDLLVELDTTVEGVAAVIAIYTATLALVPIPAAALARRVGARAVATGGFSLFTAASLVCAGADSLTVLLVARALQGVGGAAGLVAAFPLVRGGDPVGRRWWIAAAVFATATGPALGGALTEAFDWRAIFIVQAPVAAAAVLAALTTHEDARPQDPSAPVPWRPAVGLTLLSAALTAVIFLLVLLLIAGLATEPLKAAGLVTITPLAALLGAVLPGDQRARAAAGALLIGGGTLALAWLPGDRLAYTVVPQLLAGTGMGLALTALAGHMLPERTAGDAARLLSLRHAGIALAIIGLAPLVAADLDAATERAQLRGVALVLDADLEPTAKLDLAPALLSAVNADRPRAGLREAAPAARRGVDAEDRAIVERVIVRADAVLVGAVSEAFKRAFQVTGALALLAALVLLPLGTSGRALAGIAVALALAAAAPLVYAREEERLAPEPVRIADPCQERDAPDAGGLGGFLQGQALAALDRSACDFGSSREELVLALFDDAARRRFMLRYNADPRDLGGILGGLFGVKLTHPDKLLFPADGFTKADLLAYFETVSAAMLPHVRDRPLSLERYDRGIDAPGVFFQRVPKGAPSWLRRAPTPKRGGGEVVHPLVHDVEGLRWLAQQNVPTVHTWTARRDRLDRPDRLVWDLDPPGPEHFGIVRATALALGEVLREAGREPWVMTSGSKGLHVVLPLARRASWEAARDAMRAVAEEVVARDPQTRTREWRKEDREGRLLIDLRTRYGHTVVAPYSVRALPGAPVATPLRWDELEDPALHAQRFGVSDVPARLEAGGDPWARVSEAAAGLPRV